MAKLTTEEFIAKFTQKVLFSGSRDGFLILYDARVRTL